MLLPLALTGLGAGWQIGPLSTLINSDTPPALMGEGPLTYLARWRLQLAARLLQTTRKTILQVAAEVGYESEAAFSRAFKREFDVPPAKYRMLRALERR